MSGIGVGATGVRASSLGSTRASGRGVGFKSGRTSGLTSGRTSGLHLRLDLGNRRRRDRRALLDPRLGAESRAAPAPASAGALPPLAAAGLQAGFPGSAAASIPAAPRASARPAPPARASSPRARASSPRVSAWAWRSSTFFGGSGGGSGFFGSISSIMSGGFSTYFADFRKRGSTITLIAWNTIEMTSAARNSRSAYHSARALGLPGPGAGWGGTVHRASVGRSIHRVKALAPQTHDNHETTLLIFLWDVRRASPTLRFRTYRIVARVK